MNLLMSPTYGSSSSVHQSLRARSGFSLLEVIVGLTILSIGMLAMTSTTVGTYKLRNADASRLAARNAIESVAREVELVASSIDLDAGPWAREVLDAFAAPADQVEVPGLGPWAGETSVISIEILSDETRSDADLGVHLGMPRDLDRDGAAANTDVSDTGRMLPVIVRARWNSAGGPRQIEQGFYVLGYGS